MADLRTTAEERARLVAMPAAMPWIDVLDVVADIDTLLAENARLRAVAEAAREYREMCAPGLDMCRDVARDALDAALAALEAL